MLSPPFPISAFSILLICWQERNIHDYFDDFVDEMDMYRDAGRLIEFLSRWSSTKPFFFDRALDLANDMVVEGFWGSKVHFFHTVHHSVSVEYSSVQQTVQC